MTVAKKIPEGPMAALGAIGVCAGANIRTPCGPRRVEFVRKGDLIVTRDNGLQPVRMVWARTISETELAADPSLAPVVVEPRAIAPMMPQRALSLGLAHRILVPGWRLDDEDDASSCLVPSRDFVATSDQSQSNRLEPITYYNIVFDEPQVFCANGLPIESFTPNAASLSELPEEVVEELSKTFPSLSPGFVDYPKTRYKARERVSYTPDFSAHGSSKVDKATKHRDPWAAAT